MQFHSTGTDPTREALLVCRNTRWNILVLLAIFWAAPIFWWIVAAPVWVTGLCAFVPLLITWPMVSTWRKRGRADNWVLAIYRDGIWLNLRDCEYYDAEPAESVVFVPYSEIIAARRHVHRYTTPSSDGGNTSYKDVYLELELNAADCGELRIALDDEGRRESPPRSYFGGFIVSRTPRTRGPICLEGERMLRIKFTVSNFGLRPSLKRVLTKLQGFVNVDGDKAPQREEWDQIDGDEFDALVRRLAKNGEQINAVALLRSRTRMSMTEAKQFVDQISDRTVESEHLLPRG
ncbi:MAG: hypothetical protein WD468_06105 [Pirellulales bacterium]